jgi:outer membrane protein TolC
MFVFNALFRARFNCVAIMLCLLASPVVATTLPLARAIDLAQKNDPWLLGNHHSQASLDAMSIASAALPNPNVSMGVANLPTDTWDFDQEPMTQFKVGVTQMFPRGDQLQLARKRLLQISAQMPLLRAERRAQIQLNVSQLWLDAYLAQESIHLIEKNRYLFEQLTAIAQSAYASALERTTQQDVIRAQLELTHLQDRLTMLQQQRDVKIGQLMQWISTVNEESLGELAGFSRQSVSLPARLPTMPLRVPPTFLQMQGDDWQQLSEAFLQHPSVLSLDKEILAAHSSIDIAKQKYKPEWGINASYGYRDTDPMGNERADFFSLGVTLDVPIFNANRQDKEVASAVSNTESIKTKKWMQLKAMLASFESARSQWLRLNQRMALYKTDLLPQIHQQAEAALTAYTNDSGDFSDVMRARISELNAKIEVLNIAVMRQKAVAQLNYFFVSPESADVAFLGHDVEGNHE